MTMQPLSYEGLTSGRFPFTHSRLANTQTHTLKAASIKSRKDQGAVKVTSLDNLESGPVYGCGRQYPRSLPSALLLTSRGETLNLG